MTSPPIPTGSLDDQLTARLLHQRIIVLGQEVDDAIANRLCAELLLLSAEDSRRDISLYINSPGGSVSAGLAIMDTMRLIPNDVSTLAMGLAASMGQFLLTAGTPGKRYALPHSRILMHQGSAGIGGTAVDVQIQAENLEYIKGLMTRLTAEQSGQDVATIEQDADRDRWFTAEQAVDYGLVDAILRTTTDIRPAADRRRIGLGMSAERAGGSAAGVNPGHHGGGPSGAADLSAARRGTAV
jgi:ATP-dependent Clp protease protease subunit